MNEHALRVLEWPSLLARLASHAATGLGREAALSLAPFTDMAGAASALRQTQEARLAVVGDGLPLGGIRDIRQVIAAPVAIGMPPPTIAFAPRCPTRKSAMCMPPPRPLP